MSEYADPIAEFNEAVEEAMKTYRLSRAAAHRKVCREQPELRKAMVAAHNLNIGRPIAAGMFEAGNQ